jgi:Flp pilus assembly protein TadD
MSEPDVARRQYEAAAALHRQGRLAEAEAAYRAVLARRRDAPLLANLASVLRGLDRFDEAVALLEEAARAAPAHPDIRFNLGNACRAAHRWAEAEAAYRETLRLAPDHRRARLHLGHLLLSLGRWAEGWPLYEARLEVPGEGVSAPLTKFPMWRGEDLAGRSILITIEQGLGDEIMFARFAPALRRRGAAKVTLASRRLLAPLMGDLADEIIVVDAEASVPPHDYWVYPASLPGRLDVTLETLSGAPYLAVPAGRQAKWAGFAEPGFNVGVVWHGNPNQPRDRYRSLPSPEALAPLRDCGARIVDLQVPREDFGDLAAIMAQLDLVVSVDTAPAHLAGALGVPCWIPYPWAGTDWRWLWYRADSPWYDAVTLYRQDRHGDWAGVMARMAADLKALVARSA